MLLPWFEDRWLESHQYFGVIIRLTNWDRNRSETHADTAMILCTTVKYEILK